MPAEIVEDTMFFREILGKNTLKHNLNVHPFVSETMPELRMPCMTARPWIELPPMPEPPETKRRSKGWQDVLVACCHLKTASEMNASDILFYIDSFPESKAAKKATRYQTKTSVSRRFAGRRSLVAASPARFCARFGIPLAV